MAAFRALLVALAATAAGLVCAPAQAADDVWRVPDRAWVRLVGHGYGHGHGMSQYGAEGAARQGLTFREIAEYYYPGTTWGTAKGRMRVLISGDTTDDLLVHAAPGLTLRDSGAGTSVVLPDNGATRWRIRVDGKGRDVVAFLTDRWRRYRVLEGQGGFSRAARPVTLVTPSGDRGYRGRLWSVAPTAGSRARDTLNVLRLEAYLKGVVPLEMPALWSEHAVRAQAVAARTYAAYERRHRSGPICDTWSCQVYGGADAEHPASDAAVDGTRGLVLRHDGEPAFTQFGSSSGGWTSAGSMPYLPAQEDRYDDWSGNPHHDWSLRVTDERLESVWPAVGNLRRIVVTQRDGNGEWGGRLRSLTLVGDEGRVVVGGDTFRASLGLRSTWVTFGVRQRS
jgi:SpoIID/LytB domain protein